MLSDMSPFVDSHCRLSLRQLSNLQRENIKIRSDQERELSNRQALQMQLENKEQLIASLKAQLETRGMCPMPTDTVTSRSRSPIKDISGVS